MGVAVIENLADLRRAFTRLVGMEANDSVLAGYDSEAQETIHHYLQHGLWNAQSWMLTFTRWNGWRTSAALTIGAAGADGIKTAALPTDFLRLDGDGLDSGLREANGTRWGTLIQPRERFNASGNVYFIEGDDISFGKLAQIPSGGLMIDYHYFHPELTTDPEPTLDFPKLDRVLIPAEAAVLAMDDGWLPFDDDSDQTRLMTALAKRRSVAASRARRDRAPTKAPLNRRSTHGTKWLW